VAPQIGAAFPPTPPRCCCVDDTFYLFPFFSSITPKAHGSFPRTSMIVSFPPVASLGSFGESGLLLCFLLRKTGSNLGLPFNGRSLPPPIVYFALVTEWWRSTEGLSSLFDVSIPSIRRFFWHACVWRCIQPEPYCLFSCLFCSRDLLPLSSCFLSLLPHFSMATCPLVMIGRDGLSSPFCSRGVCDP